MNLTKNAWHNKLYNFTYTNHITRDYNRETGEHGEKYRVDPKLPKDFCTYFWKLVGAVLLFPIYWVWCWDYFKMNITHATLGDKIKTHWHSTFGGCWER